MTVNKNYGGYYRLLMDDFLVAVIIILVVIILSRGYVQRNGFENLDNPKTTAVQLYEGFGQARLAFSEKFPPGGYYKKILPIDLKSVDISLPKLGDKSDSIRRVEIWSMNSGDPISSSESNFYNSYLEPEIEFRANPAKYQRVLRVLPGEHMKIDLATFPIKKIFLIVNA